MTSVEAKPADAQPLAGQDAAKKVQQLLAYFRSAMLVTRIDGRLHSRPMGLTGEPQEFDGTLWFFSSDSSRKIRELGQYADATLVFQCDDKNAYLQLDGRGQEVRDPARMRELYTPLLKTWFPDGLDDPHLTLIRFDVDGGHYWDSPGGRLQVLGAFAKSVLTGRRGEGGEHGDVRLR